MFENGHTEESNFSQESVISSWDNLSSGNPEDDEVNFKIMLSHRADENQLLSPRERSCREIANLTERKNPHTPTSGVKESVCLSVCYKL